MIRRLRAMWLFAKGFPLCPQECPSWDEDDARNLNHFLGSETGKKLVLTIRYREQAMNVEAVTATVNHEYKSGWAGGFRAFAAWLVSISETRTPHQNAQSDGLSEPDEYIESLRP